MDLPWGACSEQRQRTGSESDFMWCTSLEGLMTNENPENWSGNLGDQRLNNNTHFETVASSPDDSYSLSGSDDHFADVAGNEVYQTTNHDESNMGVGPSTLVIQPMQQPQHQAMQHMYTQNMEQTSSKALHKHVLDVRHDGVRTFFCGWPECKHPVGFATKPRLITHIRSTHLHEKPFICLTCDTTFTRKQDANRHAIAMNLGKQYKCSACQRAFSRKHYRDCHEERCLRQTHTTV